jgi:methionyl-tRNA formyltransferase
MRLIFMGTPEFALPSLKKICTSNHQMVGVVTAPDRRSGRGQSISESPVKQFARKNNYPLLQPENLSDPLFQDQLKAWKASLYIVVGFRILPKTVYSIPPLGSMNLHASLLPKYRGAAPIQWAIIRGERKTGVTTFMIREKVDTGDILLQRKTEIGESETGGELHDRLALLGSEILMESIRLIEHGSYQLKQQKGTPTPAPKLTPEIARINWKSTANDIHNLIRALAPKPGAYTILGEKRLKILQSSVILDEVSAPGEIVIDQHNQLKVGTGNGMIAIQSCQIEGKGRLSIDEFMRGFRVESGMRFYPIEG